MERFSNFFRKGQMKYNKILILPLLFILLVFGCKNQLVQTNDDMPSVKYGSLTIGDKTESRALKIENIKGAKVSVSGNGFSDLSTTTLIDVLQKKVTKIYPHW